MVPLPVNNKPLEGPPAPAVMSLPLFAPCPVALLHRKDPDDYEIGDGEAGFSGHGGGELRRR